MLTLTFFMVMAVVDVIVDIDGRVNVDFFVHVFTCRWWLR